MQKKLIVIFSFFTIFLIVLIGRLMYIEYTSGDKYEKIVLSQQEYDSTVIPFRRGDIVDAKGTILATSKDIYNLILDCKVLNSDKEDIKPTIEAITQAFPDLVATDIENTLKTKPKSQYIILKKELTYDQIQGLQEKLDDRKNNPKLNGIWFEKKYERSYPYGSIGSGVIGFTTNDNVGIAGLENYYNTTLNGVNGREYGYLNTENNFQKTIKTATDGDTLVSTIDLNIQSVVDQQIAAFQEQYRNGAREGAGSEHTGVIVMNPNNGEILAMGYYPNYNSADPRNLSAYYTQDQIAAMSDDDKMNILNGLWQNWCVTHTYEPGSTAKPFTVAAGIDSGKLKGNETYYCSGSLEVSGSLIHCAERAGHGTETIQDALKNSCNVALMQMAFAIGPDTFSHYQNVFGLGLKTNIDLPGEPRTDTLLYKASDMKTIDLATNAFGQNFNATMVQMISGFSSIINGGYYYKPHVVKKITDSDGNTVEDFSSTLVKQTISKTTSDTVRGYLQSVVQPDGTGHYAKIDGYSMGGKTGTAEVYPRKTGQYLVSFMGYVPQENPQVVIYVVVDKPNAADEAHSQFAQEIAKNILTQILPYMNIYPDEALTNQTPTDQTQTTQPAEGTQDTPDDNLADNSNGAQ